MSKRLHVAFSLVFVLTLAGNCVAVTWSDGGSGHLWSTGANWVGGSVPTSGQDVAINTGVADGPVIDSTVAAVANIIRMGGTGTTDTLTITGGSLDGSSHLILGESSGSTATVTMSGGTVNVYSVWVGNNGDGVLNMTGGTMNISGEPFYVSRFGGAGHVQLNGGTINTDDFIMYDATASMDLAGGVLIIDGDKRTTIDDYISSGWITAFNGSSTVNVVYNDIATLVTAVNPENASNPSPANGATDVAFDSLLSWLAGEGAASHDVYFGTTNPPAFIQNQSGAIYDPPGDLALNTTYYWQIDEVGGGTVTGDLWSFTTVALSKASDPDPDNGEFNVAIGTDLNWTADIFATSHDIYFGTSNPPTFIQNQPGTTYDPPGDLALNTMYYWRIDEVGGGDSCTGDVWSFTTIGLSKASGPDPDNGTFNVARDTDINWTADVLATSHNVYFGTDNPPPFVLNQPGTTYDPPGDLGLETTYYWRIDEVGGGDTCTGDVWSFTTEAVLSAPVFDCNTFRLEFDGSGRVSSLYYKPTGRELIAGSSGNYGFTVYDLSTVNIYLAKVNRTQTGKLLASSFNGAYQVLLEVVEDDKHIAFRVEGLIGFDPSLNTKLKFEIRPTLSTYTSASRIPAIYGDGIGVGVMSLDWMARASSTFRVDWEYLWHRTAATDDPIGGFVIFACEDDETLQTIGQVEQKEGLPHLEYNGEYAKINNDMARLNQFYVGFSGETERNKALNYGEQGGMGIFYLPQGVWEGPSSYTINTNNWPDGTDSLSDFSEQVKSKGMFLGIHTGSCSLKHADKVYVSPTPDDRLAMWGSGRLAGNISESDTVIFFIPDAGTVIPTNMSDIWGWEKIQIGNEVIKVGSYDDSMIPWILIGCSRAQEGTSSASHSINSDVKGLLTVYDHLAVDPDSTLLEEIADKMAYVVNSCDVRRVAFDALETIASNGTWARNKFMVKAYEGFDHFVLSSGSGGIPPHIWHMGAYANNGEPMHFYPKAYFEGYVIGNDPDSFVPEAFGAATFMSDSRTSGWHASSSDEWQWWLAKAAGYDATYWFWTSVGELDDNGQTPEILDLCKKWEKAKLMNVFTQAQMDQMKDFDTSFRLTSSDVNDFIWEVTPVSIEPSFVKPDDSVSVDNPYSAQPLRFEARVLPYYDYAGASNMDLLPADVTGFSVDSELSVVKNGDEWTFSSSSSSAKQANRSISTTDLSYKRGVGLWIKGDGQGGYFYIEYYSGKVRHYIVPNDFTDWRYVEIPDFEPADYYYRHELYYDFQDPYITIRQGFRYNAISTISFGLLGKAGASVTIKYPKALAEITEPLANLHMSIGSATLTVNGSVDSGNYIVYEGGSGVDVLDPDRFYVTTLPVTLSNWTKPTGGSVVTVESTSTNKPWLKLLFKTLGTPFNIHNPMDADLDDNSTVDLADLKLLTGNWLKDAVNLKGDLDFNNKVDFADIIKMAEKW